MKDAPRPRIRRTPEAARAHILGAAERLIDARGPDGVGLKDVARAAGVSHGLVTHYFGTWDGLVDAVISRHAEERRDAFIARLAEAGSGPKAPEKWLEGVFEALGDARHGRVLFWALLGGHLDGPEALPRREQGLKHVTDAMAARLAREVPGKIRRGDLEELLVIGTAAVWGYALAKRALWAALGKDATPARDAAIRRRVAAILWKSVGGSGD